MKMESFAEKIRINLKSLPGRAAQEKMAPEHRLPNEQWERYLPTARIGGILILFYPIGGSIHTVMIQRPDYDGVHSGQVSFPGGKKENSDRDIVETALRESWEEVGIINRTVKVVGKLSDLYIPPSNFLVTPVLGYADERPDFVIDKKEVSEIIEPEITELTDERIRSSKKIQVRQDIFIQAPFYEIRGRTVWGATAMIISELNEVLRK